MLNQKGLTLIEICAAFALISLTFVGLCRVFPMGLSINQASENSGLASYLSQEKIEEVFSLGYENIATGTVETKHRLSNQPDNYLYHFQRKTTVFPVTASLATTTTATGMKMISATVYYNDPLLKTEKAYNISTIISQR